MTKASQLLKLQLNSESRRSSWVSVPSYYGLLPWSLRPSGLLAAVGRFGGLAFEDIAQVPDFQQGLIQDFDEDGRARGRALPEARHAEDDVVGLRVVAGAVAVGNHRAVATEHFQVGGHLNTRTQSGSGQPGGQPVNYWEEMSEIRAVTQVLILLH